MASVDPAWSPDGRQIAYISAPNLGIDGRDIALAGRRVWLMASDGSGKRQLTSHGEGYREEAPQWSRDGSHVLFARLSTEPCDTSEYSLSLHDLQAGTETLVLSGLPLFWTENERPVVGEVPRCARRDDSGWTTDSYGRLNLSLVMSWWQPEP